MSAILVTKDSVEVNMGEEVVFVELDSTLKSFNAKYPDFVNLKFHVRRSFDRSTTFGDLHDLLKDSYRAKTSIRNTYERDGKLHMFEQGYVVQVPEHDVTYREIVCFLTASYPGFMISLRAEKGEMDARFLVGNLRIPRALPSAMLSTVLDPLLAPVILVRHPVDPALAPLALLAAVAALKSNKPDMKSIILRRNVRVLCKK
jgi:hypothetical protein